MEVLELKPINAKKIVIFLIDKTRINPKLNDIDILKRLIETNNISFITVEMDNENFKTFKNSSLSIVLDALNLDYYLLDMPEYAYGYIFEEIMRKDEQINELLFEYENFDNKNSLKGLNLKSWIDVLKKEVIHDKNILEMKIRPQWIVKKILDLIRANKSELISLIHFTHDITITEMTKQLRELHIEIINYELDNIHNIPYLIKKQQEIN